MRIIKWVLETGFVGCSQEGTFEVDENISDEEIEEAAREAVFSEISWGWEEVKK